MTSALPAAVARGPNLSKARIKKRYAAETRFKFYGLAAISFLLRYLRTRPVTVFVAYRVVLAATIFAFWIGLGDR